MYSAQKNQNLFHDADIYIFTSVANLKVQQILEEYKENLELSITKELFECAELNYNKAKKEKLLGLLTEDQKDLNLIAKAQNHEVRKIWFGSSFFGAEYQKSIQNCIEKLNKNSKVFSKKIISRELNFYFPTNSLTKSTAVFFSSASKEAPLVELKREYKVEPFIKLADQLENLPKEERALYLRNCFIEFEGKNSRTDDLIVTGFTTTFKHHKALLKEIEGLKKQNK